MQYWPNLTIGLLLILLSFSIYRIRLGIEYNRNVLIEVSQKIGDNSIQQRSKFGASKLILILSTLSGILFLIRSLLILVDFK